VPEFVEGCAYSAFPGFAASAFRASVRYFKIVYPALSPVVDSAELTPCHAGLFGFDASAHGISFLVVVGGYTGFRIIRRWP
jgi:hypothetical protein